MADNTDNAVQDAPEGPEAEAPDADVTSAMMDVAEPEASPEGAGRRLMGSVFDDNAEISGDGSDTAEPTLEDEPEAETEPEETEEPTDEAEPDEPDEAMSDDPEEPGEDANWRTRATYHQSRAERLKQELDTLKAQQSDIEAFAPLVDVIKRDPAVLDYIEAKYGKGDSSAKIGGGHPEDTPNLSPGGRGERTAPTAPPPVDIPPEPVEPEKPADYSEYDASQPGTPSWQYHEDMRQYRIDQRLYPLLKDQAETQRERAEWKAQQERQAETKRQEQAQRAYIQGVQEKVVQDFGGQPEDADGFVRWASKLEPGSDPYLKALYSAYRVREGGKKGGSAPRRSGNGSAPAKTPPPPSAAAGAAAQRGTPPPKTMTDIWGPTPAKR